SSLSFLLTLFVKKMLEGKAWINESDMPVKMQIQAMSWASQALDLYDVLDYTSIAAHIKKEFDTRYGNGWQCVVGSHFGCFFTHSKGNFIYFTLETLNFLIFRGVASSC
ncbi:cytoplasmic dynein light chain, partial [Striga asiatica]